MGAGVVISRYFGAGNRENVSKAIHTNIAFGLVSGVFLTVVGVALTPTFLVWMQTDPDVLPEAIEYFRAEVTKAGFPGLHLQLIYNAFEMFDFDGKFAASALDAYEILDFDSVTHYNMGTRKERNNDYAKREDEFFSDDHLYYDSDGYLGFSGIM